MFTNLARNHTVGSIGTLISHNMDLEQGVSAHKLNEIYLERRVQELEQSCIIRDALYSLTLARVTELALVCAGNYADHCEFLAACDLLVNPRLVLVHVRDQIEPVVKERHGGITNQFSHVGRATQEIVQWLKENTCIEIKEEALLPYLYNELSCLGHIKSPHLDSIEHRMERIADVIGFLWAWQLPDSSGVQERLRCLSEDERQFIHSNLCRFDLKLFHQLGHELLRLVEDGRYKGRFLC
ncbi:MAG: hypothetical protein P8075_11240 [Deltaproteobacteria bacterium]|jgi:hypothetical protein